MQLVTDLEIKTYRIVSYHVLLSNSLVIPIV